MDRNRPKQLTPADWAIDAAKELALAWAWLQRKTQERTERIERATNE